MGPFGGILRLSLVMALIIMTLAACGGDDDDQASTMVTVAILHHAANLQPTVNGFKAEMVKLGYTEGENIEYLYGEQPADGVAALDPIIEELRKNKNLDLILACGTPSTAKAKAAFTDLPIVFAPVNDPVAAGFVETLNRPGGNLTGIENSPTIGRALELLLEASPQIKRVLVPHNPTDEGSVSSLDQLDKAADLLDVELVIVEVVTPDEITALAANVPDDVQAIFLPRSGPILSRLELFVEAATARQFPVGIALTGSLIDDGALIGYGPSYQSIGVEAAAIAAEILHGLKPAETPVRVAEAYLEINLVTAAALGLEVPDTLLRQAARVIYPE